MTAREMFEELGYSYSIYLGKSFYGIDYKKKNKCYHDIISFDITHKTYVCDNGWEPMEIDMKEHKAIQKQLEELGWLENE